MPDHLDHFHRLRAKLRMGMPLTYEERCLYRSLGREWIALFREMGDHKGEASIKRDLGLLKRKQERGPRCPLEDVLS